MADPTPYQKSIREAFDKLNYDQKRNVLNWGTPEGLGPTPALDALRGSSPATFGTTMIRQAEDSALGASARQSLFSRASMVRQMINDQFSGGPTVPGMGNIIAEDPTYKLWLGKELGGTNPAAFVNTARTKAIAEELKRLESQYPGITSRLDGLMVGRANHEMWHRDLGTIPGGEPGQNIYEIGTPGLPGPMGGRNLPLWEGKGEGFVHDYGTLPLSRQNFFATNPEMGYESFMNSIATHELGHAAHSSMGAFARSLPADSEARAKYTAFVNKLGREDAAHISAYANQARLGEEGASLASREPFAELFSVARSPAAFDAANGNKAALRALVGGRTPRQAEKLLDNVGEFNSVEKALRNEGFNQIGAVAPELAMQLGLPALTGLLASKTHGNVKSALEGATAGAGIGGFFGPEGTLVGGALGAGAGLARQLL